MRRICVIPLFLFFLFFAGCLVSEVTEFKITLNSDGRSGTFTSVMRNVESDSPDSATQRKDFQNLIDKWKSDQYLFDQMEKGLYLRERKLSSQNGKLVWRETSIFQDISRIIPEYHANEPLKFPLSDTSNQIITTNGKLMMVNDSLYIIWPPHTKRFEMKTTQKLFTPTSRFNTWFAYGRKNK